MTTTQTILIGDCIEVMAGLPERSVHCVVTSPPYWNLRDYGVDGAIGLESTPDEYLAKMVDVFRAVWRVLRDDGTCWVNLGDSYSTGSSGDKSDALRDHGGSVRGLRKVMPTKGVNPKNLLGIPWRVAFALQADGWYLRSDIIWHKPNPMPESCTDRPTKSHEYVFLLTKKPRYFYDADAVREGATYGETLPTFRGGGGYTGNQSHDNGCAVSANTAGINRPTVTTRNRRTVWTIPTEAFPGAHFATYPRKLVAPCIKAGTSDKGCCPECGAPWVRVVERERVATRPGNESKIVIPKGWAQSGEHTSIAHMRESSEIGNRDLYRHVTESRTVGWEPGCECGPSTGLGEPFDPIPCTVLDPFSGAGTTGVVAKELGRNYIGIELNPEYAAMAERRIANPEPVPEVEDVPGQMDMFVESANA